VEGGDGARKIVRVVSRNSAPELGQRRIAETGQRAGEQKRGNFVAPNARSSRGLCAGLRLQHGLHHWTRIFTPENAIVFIGQAPDYFEMEVIHHGRGLR
jgi:hypothetical protein